MTFEEAVAAFGARATSISARIEEARTTLRVATREALELASDVQEYGKELSTDESTPAEKRDALIGGLKALEMAVTDLAAKVTLI
jgi:hypothetical protein